MHDPALKVYWAALFIKWVGISIRAVEGALNTMRLAARVAQMILALSSLVNLHADHAMAE